MKKIIKIQILLMVVLMVLSMFAGCSQSTGTPVTTSSEQTEETGGTSKENESKPQEPINLEFASWFFSEEAYAEIYKSCIVTFAEKHGNINLSLPTNPYAQYLDQLVISGAAGNAPEFAHIKQEWLPQLSGMGVLLPLNDYLSDELKNDYIESIIGSSTIDGKIMAAPWFNSPYTYYYNKTLLEKAGVSLPSNWKEFIDAVYAISKLGTDENGNKIYGLAIPNSESQVGAGYNIFPHLWIHGGDFIDENGNIVINSKENKAAFEELRRLYKDEITPNGLIIKEIRNLFGQGVVGFFLDAEAGLNSVYKASAKGNEFSKEVGAFLVPAMDGPNGSGYFVDHVVVAFNTCKNTDLINDMMMHLTDKGVEILFTNQQAKLPDRKSLLNKDLYQNVDNEITKAFIKSLNTARPIPAHESLMDADALITDALARLAITDDPVEQILADLEAKIKPLYGR